MSCRASIAVMCLLLGCAGQSDGATDTTGGDGGAGTVSDGGADGGGGDGGAGDGGGTGSVGVAELDLASSCSDVFPIDNVGVVWTYRYDDDPYQGTLELTAMGQQDYRGETAWAVQSVQATSYTQWPDNTQDQVDLTWYRCDEEGVWPLGWTSQVHTVDEGIDYEWETVYHYPMPGLLLPAEVVEGQTWSQDFEIEYKSGDGYSDSIGWQVEGTEILATAAGDLDCLRLSSDGGASLCARIGLGWVGLENASIESVTLPD